MTEPGAGRRAMKPLLTLYVEATCRVCERARAALLACAELAAVADIVIADVGSNSGTLPRSFVGVPTTVLEGRIVALGTPDCDELLALVQAHVPGVSDE